MEMNSDSKKTSDPTCLLSQAPFRLLLQVSHIFFLGNFSKWDTDSESYSAIYIGKFNFEIKIFFLIT